jgi:hypothetical protein
MPRYLLGSQCLVDIAKQSGLAPERWLTGAGVRGIDGRDIYISAVTPMIVARGLKGNDPDLVRMRENLDMLIDRYVQRDQVAPVTKNIADEWGKILDLSLAYVNAKGETKLYAFHEKLVLATAIEGLNGRPFVFVERHQPAHDVLAPRGLALEDPYAVCPEPDK